MISDQRACWRYLQDIGVNGLNQSNLSVISGKVPGLSLDTGVWMSSPFQVIISHLISWVESLLGRNGLDCLWSIDWFGGTGDDGKTIVRTRMLALTISKHMRGLSQMHLETRSNFPSLWILAYPV